eukprot:UN28430
MKKGWLIKQGRHMKSLKNRYCVLYNDKMFRYFNDEKCTLLKGEADFAEIVKVIGKDARFEVRTTRRHWRFQADSKKDATEWVRLLKAPAVANRSSKVAYEKVEDNKLKQILERFQLPNDQVLHDKFHCALQQTILHQGLLYVFTDYVCFIAIY